MGKLDEGGSRGQCAGLFSVLDDMACAIAQKFGSVIRLSEEIFDISTLDAAELFPPDNDILKNTEVDLVTAGVWVPIATALMADSTIKMAIFSPGIATILQVSLLSIKNIPCENSTTFLRTFRWLIFQFHTSSSDLLGKLYSVGYVPFRAC